MGQRLFLDLFCLANDSADLTLPVGCISTTGSYSKIPLLSWRFEALSLVATLHSRCTSPFRAASMDVGLHLPMAPRSASNAT